MQFYNCNVRPGATLGHDVPKKDISAAEIMVLQFIHGIDAVVDIQQTKQKKKNGMDKQVYHALLEKYGADKVKPLFGEGFKIELPERIESDPVEEVR